MLVGTLVNDVAIALGVAFVACLVWIIIASDEAAERHDAPDDEAPALYGAVPAAHQWSERAGGDVRERGRNSTHGVGGVDNNRWPSKRVLLVDDETRLRGILARYLRARGHVVVEASTAAEARAALSTGEVEVLLLDVNLPDDTGWAVIRWAQARAVTEHGAWAPPCVVVMSAVPPSAKRVEQFTPDAVLNKPFPIEALARLVELNCQPAALESAGG